MKHCWTCKHLDTNLHCQLCIFGEVVLHSFLTSMRPFLVAPNLSDEDRRTLPDDPDFPHPPEPPKGPVAPRPKGMKGY
mgnify:CR=1 FL=1